MEGKGLGEQAQSFGVLISMSEAHPGHVKPHFIDADMSFLVLVYVLTLKWGPLRPHPDSHMASVISSG